MKNRSLRRRAPKRQAQHDQYNPRQAEFLREHPWCQVKGCDRLSQTVHHMAGRNGARLLDESLWMATCGLCNERIEDEPAWARAQGYKIAPGHCAQ